ncbi:unnamed protein product [Coffea canephora]|uniref:DH200=94 genomic scaffold, scaffold_3886 n=1 Tax=Coffea canephora TaxID=49390 RepID=A0A068VLC7_COFCA|nr:unnamed protein product [Coffea canephora]
MHKVYNLDWYSSASKNVALSQIVVVFSLSTKEALLAVKAIRASTRHLIGLMQKKERTTARALEYFKTTRQIVLYYEDVVRNHTVRASVPGLSTYATRNVLLKP